MERSSPNSKGRPIPPLDKRQSKPSLKSPLRFRIFAVIGLLTVLAVSLVVLFVIGVKGLKGKKSDGQFTPTAMPVPAGWGTIDVDITQSSEPSFSGKVSLGAYSLRHDGLHFCFTEPGRMTRPITDVPREGIRCVVLKKSAITEPSKSTPRPGIAYSPFRVNGSAEGSSPSRLQPADEAEVVIDGARDV